MIDEVLEREREREKKRKELGMKRQREGERERGLNVRKDNAVCLSLSLTSVPREVKIGMRIAGIQE